MLYFGVVSHVQVLLLDNSGRRSVGGVEKSQGETTDVYKDSMIL